MTEALKTLTGVICLIYAITHWVEARADFVLMLVQPDGYVVTVDKYQGEDDTRCWMDYHAYERGDMTHPEVVNADRGGCIPCDEFPSMCQEGI